MFLVKYVLELEKNHEKNVQCVLELDGLNFFELEWFIQKF
jgi:hypothetical protein